MMLGPTELWGPHAEARLRFVRTVASRAELPAHLTAEAAAAAVMGLFVERLSLGATGELLAALPEPLRALFAPAVERRKGPISLLDRSAVLEQTAEHLGVTPARAEIVCGAVLHAVREELPPDVSHRIAAQLPDDLRALWYATPPEVEVPTISGTEAEALRVDVFAKIERLGELPPGIDSPAAFMAVMCTFAQRLSRGEARHVLLGLPATLRPIVTSCMLHRDEPASAFGGDEFVKRVAEHLSTTETVAEDLIRAVFSAVKTCLPSKDIEDAASQLPSDLRALWLGS